MCSNCRRTIMSRQSFHSEGRRDTVNQPRCGIYIWGCSFHTLAQGDSSTAADTTQVSLSCCHPHACLAQQEATWRCCRQSDPWNALSTLLSTVICACAEGNPGGSSLLGCGPHHTPQEDACHAGSCTSPAQPVANFSGSVAASHRLACHPSHEH